MESKELQRLRQPIALLRIVLGIILLATWWENLQKGLYEADNFANFVNGLAAGHPITAYGSFLTNVVAPNALIISTFQLIAELAMGVALILGVLTPLAGLGASIFFFNLFLSYLNPNTGEWIWTYVLLVAVALVITWARSGRAWGLDQKLAQTRGKPPLPLLW